MEPIAIIFGIIAALVMVDLAAVGRGADSRDSLPDDHRR